MSTTVAECPDGWPWTGTWCPMCGPDVACDEDGCCAVCGSTCIGPGAEHALAWLGRVRALENELSIAEGERDDARAVLADAADRIRRYLA